MKPLIDRIRDRCYVDDATGCWEWRQALTSEGYPQFQLTELFGRRSMYVRRVVYVIACGSLSSRQIVTATCENRRCCSPHHLIAMSPARFAKTDVRRDAQSRGAQHGIAVRRSGSREYKLRGKVDEIRARIAAGETQRAIAKAYGVHQTTISYIARGKTWPQANPFAALRR